MGKQYCLIGILFFLGIGCKSSNSTIDSRKLLWQDNFNRGKLSATDDWGFAGRKSADWARYCSDSPKVAYIQDGMLHLKGILNNSETDTAAYQTGCIQTKNNFSFKYGEIEVKARFLNGKGAWPAIWMMPKNPKYGGWPQSGEIDIMEHLNSDALAYQTVHSQYIDVRNHKKDPKYYTTASINAQKFNIYGLKWYPDRLEFFMNGRKTFIYPKKEGTGAEQWPFDQPFYLILDQALGGSWVGKINDDDLPVDMIVDWVRVYKAK